MWIVDPKKSWKSIQRPDQYTYQVSVYLPTDFLIEVRDLPSISKHNSSVNKITLNTSALTFSETEMGQENTTAK